MPGIHLNKALESKTVKFIRWKVHNDWVEQIRIEQRLNQIISCSNDDNNALVIGCVVASTDIDSSTGAQTTINANSISGSGTLNTQQLNASSVSQQQQDYGNVTLTNKHSSDNMTVTNTVTITVPTITNQDLSRKQSVQTQQQQSTTAIIQSATMITSASSLAIKRRPDKNETVFKVYKGVKTFDFSMEKNLLITGGKFNSKL
jgi:hypothetical protein